MANDSPTHRLVNGERIDLTPEEIVEIEAEWAIEEAKPPEPPPRNLEAEVDELKARIVTLELAK